MALCRCDARYAGCEHGVPCPTPPPSDQGNLYFCTPCDQRRITFITKQLDDLVEYVERSD